MAAQAALHRTTTMAPILVSILLAVVFGGVFAGIAAVALGDQA